MNLTRHTRKLLALIGAGVILFAQFAMAAHACMVMAPAQAMSVAGAVGGENPPCHEADTGELNACVTHCQGSVQPSFDNPSSPLATQVPVVAYSIARQDFPRASLSAQGYAQALLKRVTAPPAMVRNCCLRI